MCQSQRPLAGSPGSSTSQIRAPGSGESHQSLQGAWVSDPTAYFRRRTPVRNANMEAKCFPTDVEALEFSLSHVSATSLRGSLDGNPDYPQRALGGVGLDP